MGSDAAKDCDALASTPLFTRKKSFREENRCRKRHVECFRSVALVCSNVPTNAQQPTERVAVVKRGVSASVRRIWICSVTKGCLKRALVAVLAGHNENGVPVAIAHIYRDTPVFTRSRG